MYFHYFDRGTLTFVLEEKTYTFYHTKIRYNSKAYAELILTKYSSKFKSYIAHKYKSNTLTILNGWLCLTPIMSDTLNDN